MKLRALVKRLGGKGDVTQTNVNYIKKVNASANI